MIYIRNCHEARRDKKIGCVVDIGTGEVDHDTLSPCAFLSSDNLALSVVDLASSALLTFLDLYEH